MLLQFLLTSADVQEAPKEVQSWLISKFPLATPDDSTAKSVKKKKKTSKKKKKEEEEPPAEVAETQAAVEETTEEAPTKKTVIDTAMAFIADKDESALTKIFGEMGISKLSECPAEHYCELMSRMAAA